VTERLDFRRTLGDLARALARAGVPYMVIGGLAVLVRGVPRLTRDVDVVVGCPPAEVGRLVRALRPEFEPLVEDPEAFAADTMVVPVAGVDGTRVDIILAGLPFEHDAIARAKPEVLGGVTIRVCTAEDLILMKIVSDRPKDREDVAGLLRARAGEMDLPMLDRIVAGIAADLEDDGILESWRRLRAERS
jgi:hypothetical protein